MPLLIFSFSFNLFIAGFIMLKGDGESLCIKLIDIEVKLLCQKAVAFYIEQFQGFFKVVL